MRKKWLLGLLALASVLLNVALLFFLLAGDKAAAEENRGAGRKTSSPAEAKTNAVRALNAKPARGRNKQPKMIGMPGEGQVAMPWVFAKQIIGSDAFVPYSNGLLNSWLKEMLSITPAESETLRSESSRLLAMVKKSEAERVKLVKDDSGAEYYEIPADPEFSRGIRDTMAEAMIRILGPDRGAVLADAMVTKYPLFPNPGVRIEISIETHTRPIFTIRRFAADETFLGGKGTTMNVRNIEIYLEERYGHIVDFAAWKMHLEGDGNTGSGPGAIDPR